MDRFKMKRWHLFRKDEYLGLYQPLPKLKCAHLSLIHPDVTAVYTVSTFQKNCDYAQRQNMILLKCIC